MCGRDARRQDQAVVVAVHHDHGSDNARAHAPTSGPTEFLFAIACLELNPARARKILPEKMRRAGLDRFSILHHRFDAKVWTAPGKRSLSDFSPLKTGMAT